MTRAYTLNKVFASAKANSICDRMFSELEVAFPPTGGDPLNDAVFKKMVLSGAAAAIIQGATAAPVKNIAFETESEPIFVWLRENMERVFGCRVIKFRNRTLCYFGNEIFFEIWKAPIISAILVASTYYVQEETFIPANLL